jgi:hypothetical protein
MGLHFPTVLLHFRTIPAFMSRLSAEQVKQLQDELSALLKEQSDSESSNPSPMSQQERAKCIQRLLRIAQIRDIFGDNLPSAALPPNRPSKGETVPENDLLKARIAP